MCYPSACDESFARPCRRPRECARLRPPADRAARVRPHDRGSYRWQNRVSSNSHPGRHPELMAAVQFIVEGGATLSGSIRPSGNKNAALPIIAASLLSEHPVTLENVPRIRDTETLVELMHSVGASAEWTERNTLHIHAKTDSPVGPRPRALSEDPRVDPARRVRCSRGAVRSRCRRPAATSSAAAALDTHFLALEQLGADVSSRRERSSFAPRSCSAPTSFSMSRASPRPRTR